MKNFQQTPINRKHSIPPMQKQTHQNGRALFHQYWTREFANRRARDMAAYAKMVQELEQFRNH